MTREEAIKGLKVLRKDFSGYKPNEEMFDMAIEALKADITKWRTWSHTYDNACIDGTLEVKVEDATKIGRVLISDDEHRGGLYYPDEDEPQGDLISRAEAIEAIEIVDWYHQNQNKDMVSGANNAEHQAWYKAEDVYKALEAVPSADRSSDEEDQLKFYYIESIDDYWIGMRIDNFYYADWHEGLGFVWSKSRYLPWGEHIVDENTLWKEHTYPSEPVEMPFTDWIVGFVKKYFADRPRGKWIHTPNGIDRDFVWWVCSECGHKIFSETEKDRIEFHAYCGRCGADMRPTERSEE